LFRCKVCKQDYERRRVKEHEGRYGHILNLDLAERQQTLSALPDRPPLPFFRDSFALPARSDAQHGIAEQLSTLLGIRPPSPVMPEPLPPIEDASYNLPLDIGNLSEPRPLPSTDPLLDLLACIELSPESDSDEEDERDEPEDPHNAMQDYRARVIDPRGDKVAELSNPYFPWPDREVCLYMFPFQTNSFITYIQTCVLDILKHIPRMAFSRMHMEAIVWAMTELGLTKLPTESAMMSVEKKLHNLCGVQSIRYQGAHGHIYYLNDLAAIIAQVIICVFISCMHLPSLRRWQTRLYGHICHSFLKMQAVSSMRLAKRLGGFMNLMKTYSHQWFEFQVGMSLKTSTLLNQPSCVVLDEFLCQQGGSLTKIRVRYVQKHGR
jgi:hypothetical protein